MSLIIVVLLGSLMHATRSFGEGGGSGGTLLSFGYLLLSGFFVGNVFKQIRLPRLTGYLFTGFVVGPSGLAFLSERMVGNLNIVNGVAVALIALTAGCELEIRQMRPHLRAVGWISLFGVGGTCLLLTAAVFLGRQFLPFMNGMDVSASVAISAVLGVVIVAQSPAVVIALLEEMRAQGPVARTALGVVVLADLVVIILFAIVSLIAKAALDVAASTGSFAGQLAWKILGSIGAGAAAGALMAVYVSKVRREAALFLLMVAFVIAEVGQRLQLDPLIVALAAGVLIRNFTNAGDAVQENITPAFVPVSIVFFAVAGANLHLEPLATMGLPAAALILLRAGGLIGGSWIGARVAGADPSVQRWAGFGLVPQAGLAIALSLLFAETFPQFGATAGALTLGIVAINELIAPVLFRHALVRSGEARERPTEETPEVQTT